MRYLPLVLVMTSFACSSAPSKPVIEKAQEPASSASVSPISQDSSADVQEAASIKAEDVAAVMPSTASAPVVMDQVSMESQIQSSFAQNSKLSPQQSAAMTASSMALINAAQAGDQAAVKGLANDLLKQAMNAKGLIGFGLLDPAGILAAIMDLIAAAADADVAGIIDAIQDLVAAIV